MAIPVSPLDTCVTHALINLDNRYRHDDAAGTSTSMTDGRYLRRPVQILVTLDNRSSPALPGCINLQYPSSLSIGAGSYPLIATSRHWLGMADSVIHLSPFNSSDSPLILGIHRSNGTSLCRRHYRNSCVLFKPAVCAPGAILGAGTSSFPAADTLPYKLPLVLDPERNREYGSDANFNTVHGQIITVKTPTLMPELYGIEHVLMIIDSFHFLTDTIHHPGPPYLLVATTPRFPLRPPPFIRHRRTVMPGHRRDLRIPGITINL